MASIAGERRNRPRWACSGNLALPANQSGMFVLALQSGKGHGVLCNMSAALELFTSAIQTFD
jgi:hypothetical protein